MSPTELIRWQWTDYSRFHASKLNLLIHIVAVPVFLVANVSLVLALLQGNVWRVVGSLIEMLLAFGVQAIGHGKESNPSIPFSSATNALGRIFVEQWINFPRYVLSGGWWRAFAS